MTRGDQPGGLLEGADATPANAAETVSDQPCGPLEGVRVLDLSRILAGPTMTQLLGDLGADVIKVEHPRRGDDTRAWGPPFLEAAAPLTHGEGGTAQHWSSYFLFANRNKRSLALDISKPEGQEIVRRLAAQADVLVENFKVGGLAKYGLAYDDLAPLNPRLVYCSITGFGQTGPLKHRPGYDAIVQAMGGLMSITGEADGEPMKVGVGIADMFCGLQAGIAVLAALLRARETGKGQYIDIALLDSQLSWLGSDAINYFLTGETPHRRGSAHPNIVPYQVFPASDGHFMLGVGNDAQFRRFCEIAGVPELAQDPRFATNPARIKNRDALIPILAERTARHPRAHWIEALAEAGVPAGPINTIPEAFAEPQAKARGTRLTMHDPKIAGGKADLIANPIRFSETPVTYRRFPPLLGEHSDDILEELLDMESEKIAELKARGIVSSPVIERATTDSKE